MSKETLIVGEISEPPSLRVDYPLIRKCCVCGGRVRSSVMTYVDAFHVRNGRRVRFACKTCTTISGMQVKSMGVLKKEPPAA